jgi:hypothetical protein
MKISLTKIKNWSSKSRLKEIEKRIKQIGEDEPNLSDKSKDALKQVLLILKVEKSDNVSEGHKSIKIDQKEVNVFE